MLLTASSHIWKEHDLHRNPNYFTTLFIHRISHSECACRGRGDSNSWGLEIQCTPIWLHWPWCTGLGREAAWSVQTSWGKTHDVFCTPKRGRGYYFTSCTIIRTQLASTYLFCCAIEFWKKVKQWHLGNNISFKFILQIDPVTSSQA